MDAKWLDRRWLPYALALSAGLLAAVAILDATTAYELDLTPFYLVPIAIATWHGGYRWGALGAALALAAWGSVDQSSGHVYSSPFYAAWAGIDRALAFVMIAGAVGLLSRTHRRLLALNDSRQKDQARFRDLFDQAGVGTFRARLDGGGILECSGKTLEILGEPREEVIGRPFLDFWADPERREELVRRLEADGRVTDFELTLVRGGGETRHCLASLRPVREEGVMEGSLLDVTERRRAEETIARLQAQLQLASPGALAAGAARDAEP